MPFDKELIEAQLSLNRILLEEMPKLAWDALEAGFDGPAIRRLAAFDKPTGFEIDEVLPRVMEEMEVSRIAPASAARLLMKRRACAILEDGSDPLKQTDVFFWLWVDADYPSDLASLGTLDDWVNVKRCMGENDDQIRDWVRMHLVEFVSQNAEVFS